MHQQTIICMKWGTRYGVDYVNRLASMIRRNTRRPTRIICFTERPHGVDEGVETAPLPPINIPERVQWLGWRKISLWQAPFRIRDSAWNGWRPQTASSIRDARNRSE